MAVSRDGNPGTLTAITGNIRPTWYGCDYSRRA